jgi:hypothetical protein
VWQKVNLRLRNVKERVQKLYSVCFVLEGSTGAQASSSGADTKRLLYEPLFHCDLLWCERVNDFHGAARGEVAMFIV